ncbi:MAG: hypothetical protein S4CHLAM6_10200 [Chlamydiae bacterium]|nr:hypothetical protein [Chlamydiota bacterium]
MLKQKNASNDLIGSWNGNICSLPNEIFYQSTQEYSNDQKCKSIIKHYREINGKKLLYTYAFYGIYEIYDELGENCFLCNHRVSQVWLCPHEDEIALYFKQINLHNLQQWTSNKNHEIHNHPLINQDQLASLQINEDRLVVHLKNPSAKEEYYQRQNNTQ